MPLTQYDVIHKELEGLRVRLTAGWLVPAVLVVGVLAPRTGAQQRTVRLDAAA
jgi:hypothetical protein